MTRFTRAAGSLAVLVLAAGPTPAANDKTIETAVERGAAYLKSRFKPGAFTPASGIGAYGIGPTALSGLALLEAKVPANDPALQAITKVVRDTAYRETKTYQIALCLLFLDRLDDPADVPLIQVLAVRLLAGQTPQGGWGYECISAVPPQDEQALRAIKPLPPDRDKPPSGGKTAGRLQPLGKFHPDVQKYAGTLANAARGGAGADDNSNTQFGLLAVWVARKHGVPVEGALDLVEKRFLATQSPTTGGWDYSGGTGMGVSHPAMTCAGLLGLSTGVARREERRLKAEAEAKTPPPKKGPHANDPFFNPPPRKDGPGAKKEPKRSPAASSPAVQLGFTCLGAQLLGKTRGVNVGPGGGQPTVDHEMYFLWSMERVGVIYGVDKIGGIDWYGYGSEVLLRAQGQDGSWGTGTGYGPEVCTSFAILFLSKADLARDLSSRVRKDPATNELRAGNPAAPMPTAPEPSRPGPGAKTGGSPRPLPIPVEDESSRLAAQLVLAPADGWTKALERIRDARGGDNTKGLVLAIHRLDGDRKKQAREALAERLTRMSADTLRGMMKSDDAELRRGAVLAGAMKDDKAHVPDLIDRLTDEEELVVRAAHAGLKSLTSRDFGPKAGATKDQRKAAATAWRNWWAKQK